MDEEEKTPGLSDLELSVLSGLRESWSLKMVSDATKLTPAAVGRTIAKLQMSGYISAQGSLTPKGLNAIRESMG